MKKLFFLFGFLFCFTFANTSLAQTYITVEGYSACTTKKYLNDLITYSTQKDYDAGCFTSYNSYTVSTKSTLTNVEEAIEFNNFHEGIHLGYILAMKNSIIS